MTRLTPTPMALLALALGLATALAGAGCGQDEPVRGDGDLVNVSPDADRDTPGLDGFPNADGAGDDATDAADQAGADAGSDGDVGGDVAPLRSCERDEDCVDQLPCTSDTCGDDGFCEWTVLPNRCLINNVCYDRGTIDPDDPCSDCHPPTTAYAWSPRAEGADCTDGDRCTVDTTCQSGACLGAEVTCNDGNDCTADTCDAELGCVFDPVGDGADCDDGSACTDGDMCLDGECAGEAIDCDDGNDCTVDDCDADTGCTWVDREGACEDGDACTVDDFCDGGECVGGDPANCDDGNICTIDVCNEHVGCVRLPSADPCCQGQTSICDDGDPCTTDLCGSGAGECLYELNTASCDDQNACTEMDRCSEGECGGRLVDCDDDNSCTDDVCNATEGCLHLPLAEATCTDDIECTIDACVDGVCVSDASNCVCEPTFSPVALKATALRVGVSGQPGEGLDIDDDPSTCSPPTNCSGGVNNAVSLIASFVNADLQAAVDDGSLILLVELRDFTLNPFELAVYTGELDPANAECAVQTDRCAYLVSASALDPGCDPLVSLSANRVGDQIYAGGPGTVLPFDVPLGDAVLSLTLYEVQVEGELVEDGGEVASFSGVLGGAVLRSELLDALEALPPDSLPFDPADIANVLDLLVDDDIDVDGDGEPDAISIGLPLVSIRADLTGVTSD